MDSLEQNLIRLQRLDPRVIVAVAAACAERTATIYDDLGSGDPVVLHDAVDALWRFVEGDQAFVNASDVRDLLQEYADAHFEEEDQLMGYLVSIVLEAVEAYLAREGDDCSVHAARALEAHAELSEEADGTLADDGQPPAAVAEEEQWRDGALHQAERSSGPIARGDLGVRIASWIPALVAAG